MGMGMGDRHLDKLGYTTVPEHVVVVVGDEVVPVLTVVVVVGQLGFPF